MSEDRNCLTWWLPRLEAAGLPVPDTRTVETHAELWMLLDGETPPAWDQFMHRLTLAAEEVGPYPVFLRTGHTSGKHRWRDTCHVGGLAELAPHVTALVEESFLAIPGLPTGAWAARRMIETRPLFRAFDGMPVVREFRLFARDGEVEHAQPYWPPDAIARPDVSYREWRALLTRASLADEGERATMLDLAHRATAALGGHWSIDLLEDAAGRWWLTDCAEGDRSFRWDAPDVAWPELSEGSSDGRERCRVDSR